LYTIKGLRGSGTNFLQSILDQQEQNWVEPYWKHDVIDDELQYYQSHDIEVHFIYKNFFSWLLSLRKYSWHMNIKDRSIESLLTEPIYSFINQPYLSYVYDLNEGDKFDSYKNAMEMYCVKNKKFNKIANQIYSYESLLKEGRVADTVFEFNEDRKKYYLDQQYMQEYTTDQVEMVNDYFVECSFTM